MTGVLLGGTTEALARLHLSFWPSVMVSVAWSVISEIDAVTSPEFVRDADDFFQGLADWHGAEYDGWEASL